VGRTEWGAHRASQLEDRVGRAEWGERPMQEEMAAPEWAARGWEQVA